MKYLLIIALIFFGGGLLLYLRLRPQIRAARRMWQILRAARVGSMPPGQSGTLPPTPAGGAKALARCAACGTWTPAANALKLGAQSYCSHDCLEKKSARRV